MAQQIVTAAQWDSNKTTLFRVIFKEYHLDCPKALNVQIEVYYKIDILLNNFLTMKVVYTVSARTFHKFTSLKFCFKK